MHLIYSSANIRQKYYFYPTLFAISVLQYILLFTLVKGLDAVRVVALNVPSQVRKGSEVEMSCLYDLGNASLYSLKWFYRANDTDLDEQEFFRYTPTIKPYKQFFPLDGVNVNVNKSERGRVVITETNGKTSGKYKCEISVEGTFQTVAAEKLMTVLGNGANQIVVTGGDRFYWTIVWCLLCWLLTDGDYYRWTWWGRNRHQLDDDDDDGNEYQNEHQTGSKHHSFAIKSPILLFVIVPTTTIIIIINTIIVLPARYCTHCIHHHHHEVVSIVKRKLLANNQNIHVQPSTTTSSPKLFPQSLRSITKTMMTSSLKQFMCSLNSISHSFSYETNFSFSERRRNFFSTPSS